MNFRRLTISLLSLATLIAVFPAAAVTLPKKKICSTISAGVEEPAFFRMPHENFVDANENMPLFVNPTKTAWTTSKNAVAKKSKLKNKPFDGKLTFQLQPATTQGPFLLQALSQETLPVVEYLLPYDNEPKEGGINFINRYVQHFCDGIRIQAKSNVAPLTVTLVLGFKAVTGIDGIGKGPRFVKADFQVSELGTSQLIHWKNFTVISQNEADAYQIQKHGLGIFVEKSKNPKLATAQLNQLSFEGPFIFDTDLRSADSSVLNHILQINHSVPNTPEEGRQLHIERDGRTRPGDVALIKLLLDNLYDSSKQDEAITIAAKGANAVIEELNRLGFSATVLDQKVGRQDFFLRSEMNTIWRRGYLSTGVLKDPNPKVPVEDGDFGREHGELSHALQVIAMTRGMSNSELDYFRKFYAGLFSLWNDRWLTWDALFDGLGADKPTAPFFWRNRLEQLGISPK